MNVKELKTILTGKKNKEAVIWKGLVAGFAGGVTGAFAMSVFESFVDKKNNAPGLSPTVKATNSLRSLGGLPPLDFKDAQFVREVGKYPFGALIGAGYGVLVENFPVAKKNQGLGLSTLVYSALNQSVQPSMSMLNTLTKDPLNPKNRDFISLAVFGFTTELVRRGLRSFLG